MRALLSLVSLVRKYVEYRAEEEKEEASVAKQDATLRGIGEVLGAVLPRCGDSSIPARRVAFEATGLLLYADQIIRTQPAGGFAVKPHEMLVEIVSMRKSMAVEAYQGDVVVEGAPQLARILSTLISPEELPPLLLRLLKSLADGDSEAAKMAALLTDLLIESRGLPLRDQVVPLVKAMKEMLAKPLKNDTVLLALRACQTLAAHHLIPFTEELLKSTVPHEQHVIKMFQSVARREELAVPLCRHILTVMNAAEQYEQRKERGSTTLYPTMPPQAATCALEDIMRGKPPAAMLRELYPVVMASLLIRVGTVVGIGEGIPSNQVKAALEALCELSDDKAMEVAMGLTSAYYPPLTAEKAAAAPAPAHGPLSEKEKKERERKEKEDEEKRRKLAAEKEKKSTDRWTKLTEEKNFHEALACIANKIGCSHPEAMDGMLTFMGPYLSSTYQHQRLAAVAVAAEFMRFVSKAEGITQRVLNAILGRAVDEFTPCKLCSLRGVSYMGEGCRDQVNRYAAPVLAALVKAIDDTNEGVALQAMSSLSQLLECFGDEAVAPMLINMCLCARPLFERPSADLRAAAFRLFGILSLFGRGAASQAYLEQSHANLPAIILHLQDEDKSVQKICKVTLRQVAPLLNAPALVELVSGEPFEPEGTIDPEVFAKALSVALIRSFPERLNYYAPTFVTFFQSKSLSLKMGAIQICGYLLANLVTTERYRIGIDHVCSALVNLLRDDAAQVRTRAAFVLSLLHDY